MGAVPKRRISTRRKGKRRHAIKLNSVKLVQCPNCDKLKQTHRVCSHCGHYGPKTQTQ